MLMSDSKHKKSNKPKRDHHVYPNQIYGAGLEKYLTIIGIPPSKTFSKNQEKLFDYIMSKVAEHEQKEKGETHENSKTQK